MQVSPSSNLGHSFLSCFIFPFELNNVAVLGQFVNGGRVGLGVVGRLFGFLHFFGFVQRLVVGLGRRVGVGRRVGERTVTLGFSVGLDEIVGAAVVGTGATVSSARTQSVMSANVATKSRNESWSIIVIGV